MADVAEYIAELGLTQEQVNAFAEAIAEGMRTAEQVTALDIPSPAGQTALEAAQAAATKTAEGIYEGTREGVPETLQALAETAVQDAADRVELLSAAEEAAGRLRAREAMEEERVQYSLRRTEGMSWESQVDAVVKRGMLRDATLNLQRSGILTDFGLPDIAVGMNIGDLRKAMREKRGSRSGHALEPSVVKAFQKEIIVPVAAFENAESGTMYVLTHESDRDGDPVVLVIRMNQQDGEKTPMHQVKSAYGMKNVMGYMTDHLPEGSRYAVYDKETLDQILSPNAQYIMTGADTQRFDERFVEIIARRNGDVNGSSRQFSERRATAPKFRETLMGMKPEEVREGAERNLLVKYQGDVNRASELQEQIREQEAIVNGQSAEDDKKTARNRLSVLRSELRTVSSELRKAERAGGFANLMNSYRSMVTAYMAVLCSSGRRCSAFY